MTIENRQFFQTLFHAVAEGIVISDNRGVITSANPAACNMFGYHKLEGVKVEQLMPDHLRETHLEHRKEYHKSPEARSMGKDLELYGKRKSGDVFPVEISLSPSEIDGNPVVIAFVIDISERKKRESAVREYSQKLESMVEERTRELNENQKLYRAIARNFPEGMISVFDRDLRYVFVEGKELYALGITSESLMGTRYLDRLAPEIAQQTEQELLEVFDGTSRAIEIKHRGNDYILEAVPIPGESGKVEHILVIEKNITQRKRDEEKVKRALEHEKELNELKSRFVSTASHEFRTPLSTILSSVSLLTRYLKEGQEEQRNKHIQRIKGAVHNLTGILNDFLSLDKLETGAVKGNPVLFNVEDFVADVVDQVTPTLRKGQKIQCQHAGAKEVYLDKQMLTNILVNLLSNASKYSGPKPISLTTKLQNQKLMITVEDQGMGISKEDQKHLFERFFRSNNTVNIPGTGLGLNIVKKYIDLIGGNITVSSELGEGSSFKVILNQHDHGG